MPVLSMPNVADQQQTLPTDQYGYSTAQPWPPLPQVSLVTVYLSVVLYSNLAVYVLISSSQLADVPVGGGDMSLLSTPSLPQGRYNHSCIYQLL